MRYACTFVVLLAGPGLFADAPARMSYLAGRTNAAPKIDGVIDDSCWTNIPSMTDFIQFMPEAGKPSHFTSNVYVTYDDRAVYVAAQLDDPEPQKIATVLTPRDQRAGNVADHFIVGFDTYLDGLNGYRFEITAAGVQADARLSPQKYDLNWDAVWESRVQVNEKGWAVEMRIPYSAIRFPNRPEQKWGMQFTRSVQRTGELSTWTPTDPKVENIVQQWGVLEGLRDIKPPMRLSFTPYIAGYAEHFPDGGTPPGYTTTYRAGGGMDIKYGINESFTIDATLIPDFGQVQSDNTILNLSPFEVRYEERRPFFTEGTELFGKSDIFYSRRIGGRPLGYYDVYGQLGADEEVKSNPAQTRLYNATKFSGRTKKGLGIGVLNAVAAPMYATVKNTITGQERRIQTGALSNYNVLVLDQNLPHNSSFTFVNTSVVRNASVRDANVSSAQLQLIDKQKKFRLRTGGNFSFVNDPYNSGPYHGFTWNAAVAKIYGKFQAEAGSFGLSKDWDPSDMGLLNAYNLVGNFLTLRWLDFDPTEHRQSLSFYLRSEYLQQLDPLAYQTVKISASGDISFRDFSSLGMFFQTMPAWYIDYYEARVPGMKFLRAPYVYFLPYYNTDQRKPVQWFIQLELAESPLPDDPLYGGATSLYVRLNDHFNFTLFTESTHDNRAYGYAGLNPATGQVMIGRRDVFVTNNEISVEYNINPRMGVNFRARHYWSKVVYENFYNLQDDGRLEEIAYLPGRDYNFNVFNIDLVYSWQFAPGSFVNVVWKNSIGQDDNLGGDTYFDNFTKTMESPQANSLIVKMIYYLDYENIRRVVS